MVSISHRRQDAIFKAIADPTRREILGILRGGRHTVGEIAENFRMTRPAISKHLRLLHSAGLIAMRKQGTSNYCGLKAEPLRAVENWLEDYETFWRGSLQSLKKHIEERR